MRARRVVTALLLAVAVQCVAADRPTIDLGWLRVSQTDNGWLVHAVTMLTVNGQKLAPGDVIYSVEDRRIDILNAVSAAAELNWISAGATYVDVIHGGAALRLQLGPLLSNTLLTRNLTRFVRPNTRRYLNTDRITELHIPDASGRSVTYKLGPGPTLIHVWSPA